MRLKSILSQYKFSILTLSSLLFLPLSFYFFSTDRITLGQPLPEFLLQQIHDDVEPWHIDKEAIDKSWAELKNSGGLYVRYKLIKGHLTAAAHPTTRSHPRFIVVSRAFKKVFSSGSFSDLDFIVCLGDSLSVNNYPTPLFTFARPTNTKGLILIPDCEALNPDDRHYITAIITQTKSQIPWNQKREVVFWRGAPTGPQPTAAEMEQNVWHRSPRFNLIKLSQKYPHLIDAAFVHWGTHENQEKLTELFPLGEPLHPKDHLFYKYLIDIDGNSCCYSRTYWTLLSNSVVLKQMTENVQWFYKGLKPNIHFIPVQDNLDDLIEKIAWCKNNDGLAQQISLQAANFAICYLQYESNLNYLFYLLKTYSKHLNFQPIADNEDKEPTASFMKIVIFELKSVLRKKLKKNPIASLNF